MPHEPLEKKTLNFREGDFEYLDRVYQPRGTPVSVLVRRLVSLHVDGLRSNDAKLPKELLE